MRRWFLWISISTILLALLIWRTRPWEALETGADGRPLVLVVTLNLVVIGAWAFRSEQLMAAVGQPLPVVALVPIVSFANTINNLTPASAGEALRAVILRRRHGVPYGESTAVILVERLWAIWIMALTAAAAAVGTVVAAAGGIVALAWAAGLVATFAPAVAYRAGLRPAAFGASVLDRGASATTSRGPAPEERRSRRLRLAGLLRDVDTSLARILVSPSVALGFVMSTSIVFAAAAAQLWLIVLSLGHEVSPIGAWAALGLATIAGVLSALPFGLGAADIVLTALLVALGVPAPAAGAVALLLRATVTLPLGLAGTASWIALNRGPQAPTPAADP